jgi:hypothetical protein
MAIRVCRHGRKVRENNLCGTGLDSAGGRAGPLLEVSLNVTFRSCWTARVQIKGSGSPCMYRPLCNVGRGGCTHLQRAIWPIVDSAMKGFGMA